MILRKKDKFDNDTGIWLGVVDGYQDSLKKDIPELRDLEMFGPGPTAWQVLGEDSEHFEEVALEICELIKRKDPRIGRTPKSKLKSAKRGADKKKKPKAKQSSAKPSGKTKSPAKKSKRKK
jgi:hypothetical protein